MIYYCKNKISDKFITVITDFWESDQMEVENTKASEFRTVSLRDVFEQLCRLWYAVAAIIAACLLITLFYTKLVCTPMYDSTAKIYIGKTSEQNVSTSDFAISTYLTRDYAELISDRAVLNGVIEELDLNMSYGALKQCVSVDNPENTRIIAIRVRTDDPRKSMQIAQCICEVSQEKITELFNIDRVNIISDAYMPNSPSTPNLSKNLIVSALIGIAISAVFLVFASFLNDKINSVQDVERYLGISVLAAIPYAKSRSRGYGRKYTSAQKGKQRSAKKD